MKAPPYVADFDSTSGMLRALGRYLHGRDFPRLGRGPAVVAPVAPLLNRLPRRLAEIVYARAGWAEAIRPDALARVRAEELSAWVTAQYPRRRYPAVMLGSANGAAVHLCAAFGLPWLPQTFLIPVRHPGLHPDEPAAAVAWAREPGRRLLAANPELQLHHMHDANQDRLMIQHMAYFRVKRRRLGECYMRFLRERLAPGGTIILLECELGWPTTRVTERHVFQHGALGGAAPDEYRDGGERVAAYLAAYGSHRRRWDAPPPDGASPEAEWGFEPALRDDVEQLAHRDGYRLRRIVFDAPERLSPLVADFHRAWYGERRLLANRLLVESFIVLEPWWALRTGSVPFWMVFNTEPSAEALARYLEGVDPYDEINLMLFSHGVESVGLVPIDRWRALIEVRARRRTRLLGLDPSAFPRDFASFIRYQRALRQEPARYPMPAPLPLDQLEAFLDKAAPRYGIEWR